MNNSSTSTTCLSEKEIEDIFDKMLLDYGKKFTDQWAAADTDRLIAHWARELADYSRAEIGRGLAAMATLDWPPSLPQFKKLCRSPVDPLAAYYEAVNGVHARDAGQRGEWTHPAVYWTAVRMAHDLKTLAYSAVKAQWERALAEQMARSEWDAIPEPRLALPGMAPPTREEAARRLQEMGATGIGKRVSDHKAWAVRILRREQQGDKTLTLCQVKFAREALGEQP